MKPLAALLFCAAIAVAQEKPTAEPSVPGSIAGKVTESSRGMPMKDVEVFVARNTPNEKYTVTDQQGRYVIRGVTPGSVRVSANGPDSFGRVSGFGPSASRQITLLPGQDLATVDFVLVVAGQIVGKVVDQNKEPVVGISVFLVAREYSHGALRAVFAGAGQTDDLGEYRIDRVQPGRAYVVMAQKRWRTLEGISEAPLDPQLRLPAVFPTYYPNARSIDGAEPLVVRAGERREGVDIQLARGPSFCLDAVLEGTPGPRGMRFEIEETQPRSGQYGGGGFYTSSPGGNSAPDGTVRICDLHAGDYELSVSGWGSSGRDQFGYTMVTIRDRDVAGVRVALRPKTPVAGEVVFDGPAPDTLPTAKLRLSVQAITRTERGSVQAEIPGAFAFEGGLLMDDYGLTITGVPAGLYVKDVTYGDRSMLYEPLRVGSGMANAALRVVLARDGGTAGARVADKDGNPVADCNVVVMPASAPSEAVFAAMLRTGRTSQSGTWTSASVPPGKYYLLATKDRIDQSPETIGKLWKARIRGEEVEVAPNGNASVAVEPKPID